MSKAIKPVPPQADLRQFDPQTTVRVVESLVMKGDISGLSPDERLRYYVQMCESLGLNPAAQPFAILKLNGKEVMYPTRGATDQLAAIHRINREIVDGPKVIDLGGAKLVYCVCRATHPNGRIETAVATLPLSDPANVMMKCETKGKRRATLSILGLGMLDESELETIPAGLKAPAVQIEVHAVDAPPAAKLEAVAGPVGICLDSIRDLGGEVTYEQAAAIYLDAQPTADTQDEVVGTLLQAIPGKPSSGVLSQWVFVARTKIALRAVEIPSEILAIWTKNRPSIEKLETGRWSELWKTAVTRAEDLGVKDGETWLKEALYPNGPRGGGKRKRAEAPAASAAADPERAAIQEERAPRASAVVLLELYEVISAKHDPGDIAGSYAKREWEIGDEKARARGLVVERLQGLGMEERQAVAFLDGVVRRRHQAANDVRAAAPRRAS